MALGWALKTRLTPKTLDQPCFTFSVPPMPVEKTNLPNNLLIKGERWKIRETVFSDATVGFTSCPERIIYYEAAATKADTRERLWHEITHAANCKFEDDAIANWKGFTIKSPTHDTVYKMGMFLAEFGLTNPEFLKWAGDE